MSTRNTTQKKGKGKIDQALLLFELLCQDASITIIDHLCEYEQSTFLDLLVATGLDQEILEKTLDELCLAGLVVREESLFGNYFRVNFPKLAKVSSLSKAFNKK